MLTIPVTINILLKVAGDIFHFHKLIKKAPYFFKKFYQNGCRSYTSHRTPCVFGLMKDVAHLSDAELKRRAIQRIRKRFNEPLDTLTLKWIKDENKKINDWCEKMGYQVHRDT